MKKINKELPPYSVLMSVYQNDNPEYLQQAIDSMLHQTIVPDQFVIVVDGPIPKALMNILRDFQNHSKIFSIIQLPQNKGLGNALNIGLTACSNELVARMDADDISLPQRCEKELMEFMKDEHLVICGCNIDEFWDNPKQIRTSRMVPAEYEDIRKFMRRRQAFNHPTVMYRKSKVEKVGGYPSLKRKEDFDLFSKMLTCGYYAKNINESLYLYRTGEGNYKRRRSLKNFKSAVQVYWAHLKRHGCSIWDYIVMCSAELFFLLVPYPIMQFVSDHFLRVSHK